MSDDIENHVIELVGQYRRQQNFYFKKMTANKGVINDIYGNRLDSPTSLSVVINEVENNPAAMTSCEWRWKIWKGL